MRLHLIIFAALTWTFASQHVAGEPTPGWVVGWGNNISGQSTGVPYPGYSTGLVTIAGHELTNIVSIAAGGSHSLALQSDGRVIGWGYNYYGQAIGTRSTNPRTSYHTNGVVVLGGQILTNVTAIAAWDNCSLALKSDGTVVGWGEIKVPSLSNVVAVTRGSLVLHNDGTVTDWNHPSTVPTGLRNVRDIACGYGYNVVNLALEGNGKVIAWNRRNGLQIKTPPELTDVVAISVGPSSYMAVGNAGKVFVWGSNINGEAIIPATVSNVVTISTGGNAGPPPSGYCLAIKKDGTVVAWGRMGLRAAIVPAGLSDVVAIAAGDNYCLAITTNRAVAEKFMQRQMH